MIPALVRAVGEAKRVVHALLRRFGYDLVRYQPPSLPLVRLLAEHRIGLTLDVGANDGTYARALRAGGYAGRIASFEPLSEAFGRLEALAAADPGWECRRLALGSTFGSADLNVAGNSSSSSLLPMTARHVESAPESAFVATERVEVVPLDSLRGSLWRPGERIFLKIDVQGYELPVLEGARETLEDVQVLQAELSLVPLYEGQALLPQLAQLVADAGFALVSLNSVFTDPRSCKLLQVDGLFARPAVGG
jgi:FkbM family methyltransferase